MGRKKRNKHIIKKKIVKVKGPKKITQEKIKEIT